MRSDIEFTNVEDIFKAGLHQYLDNFQSLNNDVDNAIYKMYFDAKPIQSQSQSMGQYQSQNTYQFQAFRLH